VQRVQRELVRLALADADPAQEQRPGLLVDPLSGLSAGHAQLAELAHALDERLRAWARGPHAEEAALPSKFVIVLVGHERAHSEIFGDIRVHVSEQRPHVAELRVAGSARDAASLGLCPLEAVPNALTRLLQLRARRPTPRRSHADVVQLRTAVSDVLGRAPDTRTVTPHAEPRTDAAEPTHAQPSPAAIGYHTGTRDWFGVGLAFGAADHATWLALADLAERYGSGCLRTTPQRALILPDVTAEAAPQLTAAAEQLGLITDARDPLLRTFACSGAPACASALGPTRTWARALVSFLDASTRQDPEDTHTPPNATLHISGCDKSCAASQRTSIALVHTQDGCKLGWEASIAEAALTPARTLIDIETQLRARSVQPAPNPTLKQAR
jgi:sulfite reductase beta subunit-like hemoprotein